MKGKYLKDTTRNWISWRKIMIWLRIRVCL